MKSLLSTFCVGIPMVVVWVIVGGASTASAQSKQSFRPPNRVTELEGDWEMIYASYQTNSKIIYSIRGRDLIMEGQTRENKDSEAPPRVWREKWRIQIDSTKSPPRVVMTRPSEEGKAISRVEAFEFRNGDLWLLRDDGQPITANSLRPNGTGWLTGLRRLPAKR